MLNDLEPLPSRFVRLCLSGKRRLVKGSVLSWSVRAAILADHALMRRLTISGSTVSIDTTRTGYPPTDRLLAAIDGMRTESIGKWLAHGPDCVGDVVSGLVADGTWTHGLVGYVAGYKDRDKVAIAAELHELRQARTTIPDEVRPAVLAAILLAIGADGQASALPNCLSRVSRLPPSCRS